MKFSVWIIGMKVSTRLEIAWIALCRKVATATHHIERTTSCLAKHETERVSPSNARIGERRSSLRRLRQSLNWSRSRASHQIPEKMNHCIRETQTFRPLVSSRSIRKPASASAALSDTTALKTANGKKNWLQALSASGLQSAMKALQFQATPKRELLGFVTQTTTSFHSKPPANFHRGTYCTA